MGITLVRHQVQYTPHTADGYIHPIFLLPLFESVTYQNE